MDCHSLVASDVGNAAQPCGIPALRCPGQRLLYAAKGVSVNSSGRLLAGFGAPDNQGVTTGRTAGPLKPRAKPIVVSLVYCPPSEPVP
jgi:hypothetical protein